MSQSKRRRQWSTANQMRIVLSGMEAGMEITVENLEFKGTL
jgi:hypothetical protein